MVKLSSKEIGGEIDIADLDKVLIIVAFDLPSEGKKHISREESDYLGTTRKTFVNNLKDLGCSPIQQSLFRVPRVVPEKVQLRHPQFTNIGLVEEVQRRVADFKEKYAQGWTDKDTGAHKSYAKQTRIEVLPVAMTVQGYEVFVGMQLDGLYAWINRKLEDFESWIEFGEITDEYKKKLQRDLNSIEDSLTVFFGPGAEDFEQSRYDDLKSDLEMLKNTFSELHGTVRVVKKLSKPKPRT